MQELTSPGLLARFLDKLVHADTRLLVCDYDGTLAPFTPNRDDTRFYPGVAALLHDIMASGTIVAFVTGRALAEIRAHLPWNDVEIFAAHGQEHCDSDGQIHQTPLPPDALRTLETIEDRLKANGFTPFLERKYGTIAVHWREMADDRRADIEEHLQALASSLPPSLYGTPFDGGYEFRTHGSDKGTALRTLLARYTNATVAYLGDDLTDEDAFSALPPHGLSVLVRPELRSTKAGLWLRPPEELLAFLWSWLTLDLSSDLLK